MFEIRIHDGFFSHRSMWLRGVNSVEAEIQGEKLFSAMEMMGVEQGHIELRNERNEVEAVWTFNVAKERAERNRREAKRKALLDRWEAAGNDIEDLRV